MSPILLVFIIGQRYFVQGMVMSGIKGWWLHNDGPPGIIVAVVDSRSGKSHTARWTIRGTLVGGVHMATSEVRRRGAVTVDGRLVLDGEPGLPPGPVEVVLRPVESAAGSGSGLLGGLQRIWAAQEARGYVGEPWEELIVGLDALRDEWDRADQLAQEPCVREPTSPLGCGE